MPYAPENAAGDHCDHTASPPAPGLQRTGIPGTSETPFSETAGTGAGVAGAVQRYDGVLHCLDTSDENAYRSHAAALTGGAFTGKPCLAG